MSYIIPPTEIAQVRRRRLLINGKSGSRKTTSILTSPKPIAVINYPGELGWDTIPDGDPEVTKLVWAEDEGKKVDAMKVIKEIEQTALKIIAEGKHRSLWFEGLHHFVTLAMDDVTNGDYTKGEEFEPKLYALGYRMVFDHIARMSNTNVPVVGWTCWAEAKQERPRRQGEKAEDIPKKIMSALPGQLPHQIKGRFSVMLYQSLKPRRDKAQQVVKNERGEVIYEAYWQVREAGDVICAGLKGDARVVSQIPLHIMASYDTLEAEWAKAIKLTQEETK
jgi:hypothetical protein